MCISCLEHMSQYSPTIPQLDSLVPFKIWTRRLFRSPLQVAMASNLLTIAYPVNLVDRDHGSSRRGRGVEWELGTLCWGPYPAK